MGGKFEELKAIMELLNEWAVKNDEQDWLLVSITGRWTNVCNSRISLPVEKQFDINLWNGEWEYSKTPAAESAGESNK